MYFRALHSVMCERLRSGCCVEDTSSGIGSLTRGVGGPRVIRLCLLQGLLWRFHNELPVCVAVEVVRASSIYMDHI